ncbi:hypothetical protein BB558_001112 [Smittium angustum]|uniref:Acyl-CoA thioesterase II domain-containing protein n=1 Tax=Smittium angustum TaxID=133377 RepID=A0A2U1JCM6_SMIAN|nr:hypothetical protein BB558_001112 [Smittium angustum]
MHEIRKQIYEYFFLQEADVDVYFTENIWVPKGARGVFGGQVVSQALASAILTVKTNFLSLHSYFLLAGKEDEPIYYHVERIRDGKSFASRNVLAKQKGRIIFALSCSFQVPEKSSIEHQYKMPDVVPPEESQEYQELQRDINVMRHPNKEYDGFEKVGRISMNVFRATPKDIELKKIFDLATPSKIEERAKSGKAYSDDEISTPYDLWWIKMMDDLSHLKIQLHQCLLAYISDHTLLSAIRLPHFTGSNINKNKRNMVVSLDHTVWFHTPFRADKWLLYEIESPRLVNGRGLAFGKVYDNNGVLVASVSQEGLFRTISLDDRGKRNEPLLFTSNSPVLSKQKQPKL